MKRKGMILQMLVGVFAIIFFVAATFLIFGSHININIGLKTSVEELKMLPTFNKLISSKECLSVGRMGILNKTKLDVFNESEYEPDCAYLPGVGYYVNITDSKTKKSWTFGYKGQKNSLYGKSLILIRHSDGTEHNGVIKFYKADGDPVVKLTYGAEKAWLGSEPITVAPGGKKKVELRKNEICYEPYSQKLHCKKLLNAKLNVGPHGFKFDPYEKAYVEFKKMRDDEGNLLLDLEKRSGPGDAVLNV